MARALGVRDTLVYVRLAIRQLTSMHERWSLLLHSKQSPPLLHHGQLCRQTGIGVLVKAVDDVGGKRRTRREEVPYRMSGCARARHRRFPSDQVHVASASTPLSKAQSEPARRPSVQARCCAEVHALASQERRSSQTVFSRDTDNLRRPMPSSYTRQVMRTRHLLAALRWTLVVVLAGLAVAAPSAQVQPAQRGFIWKVERGGRIGWLVGSLHMLTPDAYPLPDSMTNAFNSADTLMEEADPSELASPEFTAAMMGRAMYGDGQTLEDHVSRETFRLIADRGAAAGLPLEVLRRMKPWMIAITLQTLELQGGGFDPALGLDLHFHQLGARMNKRFSALETGLEQVGYLESLGPGLEDALIRESLQGAEAEVNEVRKIAAAWRAGDASALEESILGSLKDAPAIYQSLIVARNRAWLPKAQTCLDTARCFIVVGAGHLVGPDGLVVSLRAQGYTVTQQ